MSRRTIEDIGWACFCALWLAPAVMLVMFLAFALSGPEAQRLAAEAMAAFPCGDDRREGPCDAP